MAETVTLTIEGSNFSLDSNSFTNTAYNSNNQTVVLDRPGDIPYIEFGATASSSETAPVIDLAITSSILSEFGVSSGEVAIEDFAITDNSYNILYYWVYDDSGESPALVTDGSVNLTTDHYIRFQFKKRSDNSEITLSNTGTFRLTRYNANDNKMTDSEPGTVTAGVNIDETYTTYHPTGTWLSPVIDLKESPISMYYGWTADESGDTRVDIDMIAPKQIEYRISNSISASASSIGAVSSGDESYYLYPTDAMVSPDDWLSTANGIDVASKDRYVQFRVTFIR